MEAGLPNITGTFRGGAVWSGDVLSSAFYKYGSNGDSKSYGSQAGREYYELYAGFDASRSSPIYGLFDTVIPLSRKVMYIMKY